MRFAEAAWLWGIAVAAFVAVVLVWGGLKHQRALRRFGDPALVSGLKTAKTGTRRALRGALLVLALCFVFFAAAQPQYGRGTRLIPATNLDVVVVLDFSKSMYVRDVSPSRIARAKAEVNQLIRELGGARFGAVAFAGAPMSFPLTSDGAAVAQFFRGLEPNDMPVGGTAIARALEAARQLLERDPKSAQHERVIVLITDGEDLEGDPVAVAQALAQGGVRVHVVQIGGRTPEPIPDIDEHGQVRGLRQDASGQLLMTSLSADGEAQLAQIASKAHGQLVRAEKGTTGITEITRELRRMMTDELSEHVETVYADVYAYPLSLAILLLIVEAMIGTAPRRKPPSPPEPPPRRKHRSRRHKAASPLATTTTARSASAQTTPEGALLQRRLPEERTNLRPGPHNSVRAVWLAAALGMSTFGCEKAEEVLDRVFQHHSPVVDEAIQALNEEQSAKAVELLTSYLETGTCDAGVIGTPDRLRQRPDATFDLALGLFGLAEQYGERFGEEPSAPSGQPSPGLAPTPQAADPQADSRREQIECALRIVSPLGVDTSLPIELRARAHYLAGNLEFLRADYRAAVTAYDAALRLIPGFPEEEAGETQPDGIGRDAAHNRAIALRRLAEQPPEDPPNQTDNNDDQNQEGDQQQDPSQDQQEQDQQDDSSKDDSSKDDESSDDSDQQDQQNDQRDQPGDEPDDNQQDESQGDQSSEPEPQDGDQAAQQEAPRPSAASDPNLQRDERMLDELENAPTLQQHDARQNARRIRGRSSMEDK